MRASLFSAVIRSLRCSLWLFSFALLLAALGAPRGVLAQVPQFINYQGMLLNGTNIVNSSAGGKALVLTVQGQGLTLLRIQSTGVNVNWMAVEP